MNELHAYRPFIPPVPEGTERPLWSVMIPTYNCANYLRDTLNSVLSQDPGSEIMQIEVIDDCSTKDDPKAVVEEIGRGRVSFYRQPQNVGLVKNFETCLQRSRGQLVHILHGDDYVLAGFYRKMGQLFAQYPEIGAGFCRHIYTDIQGHWQEISPLEQQESGVLSNWLEKIASGQRIRTPSIVVRRDVYEKLGGFDRRFSCTGEDWEMWVRIATTYPFGYEVEPLAAHRSNLGSLSHTTMQSGKFFYDLRQASEIIESYLPKYIQETTANKISKQARETHASWAIGEAHGVLKTNEDVKACKNLVQEALKTSKSLKIIKRTICLIPKIGAYQFKQTLGI